MTNRWRHHRLHKGAGLGLMKALRVDIFFAEQIVDLNAASILDTSAALSIRQGHRNDIPRPIHGTNLCCGAQVIVTDTWT